MKTAHDNHTNGESQPGTNGFQDIPTESPLREYFAILARGRWTIILSVVAVLGIVGAYTFTTDPTYEASSLVLIDMKGKNGSFAMFDITGSASANKITNELQILGSNAMAFAVAEELLARKQLAGESSPGIRIIGASPKGGQTEGTAPPSVVAGRLAGAVDFAPVRESDIIRITARSTQAAEAALIANVYTEVYTQRNVSTSRTRSRAVRQFLEEQFRQKRAVLDSAEDALQHYMKRTGVVSLDAEANRVVEQLSDLEAQRDGLEVERSSRTRILASYKNELASQEPKAAQSMGESSDSYIRLLQEQLAKLEVQRDVAIAQNPEAVNARLYADKLEEINDQIDVLKRTLAQRTKAYLDAQLPGSGAPGEGNATFLAELKKKIIETQIELDGLGARLEATDAVIAEYEKTFNAIPETSIELAKLQRARLSSEKLYLLVEEKFNEAAINERSEFGYVNVVDPAIVPASPVSPRKTQNMLLGFLLGLGLGIGIVFVRSFMDSRIRTPEDLKRYGFIPLSSIGLMEEELKRIRRERESSGTQDGLDIRLVAQHRPLAPISESYRHLRTNVQYARVDEPLQCLIVTSPNPKEGKTITVANLAISFSQAEKKVLLVDADMRRPTIHTLFGLPNEVGLNDHLFGMATIEKVTHRDVLPGLDIITCGTIPPNPAEVLGSKKVREFIRRAKKSYDIILFDSPPLLAVTDAAALATEADGVLLIAAAGSTRANGLDNVAEFLAGIGVGMLGVVLNKFDVREVYGGYYNSYHYGYYGYESGYYRRIGKERAEMDASPDRKGAKHV